MTPRERQIRSRELIAKGSKTWSYSEFKEYWTMHAEDHHRSRSEVLSMLKGLKRFKITTQTDLFKKC